MAITYQIIVAKSRVLAFETSQTRIKTLPEAKKVYDLLRAKFPVAEGYSVTPCEWSEVRRTMAVAELTGPGPVPPPPPPPPVPPDPLPLPQAVEESEA